MIAFTKVNPPCRAAELRTFEARVGRDLPLDYSRFLKKQNGGRLETNRLEVPSVGGVGVADILSVEEVVSVKLVLGARLAADSWPIARDESGNYVTMVFNGEWFIAFWDHETEVETRVAGSFSELLEQTKPFDPATVELDPKDVISAWIDPRFLKR